MIRYLVPCMPVTMPSLTSLTGEGSELLQRNRRTSLGLPTLPKFGNLALEPSTNMDMRYQETLDMQLRLMSAMATLNGRMPPSLNLHLWKLTKSLRINGSKQNHLLGTRPSESISSMMSSMMVDTRLDWLLMDILQIYQMTVCILVLNLCMDYIFFSFLLNSMD